MIDQKIVSPWLSREVSAEEAAQLATVAVQDFAKWWLESRPFRIPEDSLCYVNNVSGVTLFRAGPFQVQMFIGIPSKSIPSHAHPNIDSLEIIVSGEANFDTERREFTPYGLHVAPNEKHVADAGAAGVCFLSIQKWLNGKKPSSVTHDWIGAPIDENHAKTITPISPESPFIH